MAGSFQNEIPAARINLKLDVGKGSARTKTQQPLKMLVVGDFSFQQRDKRLIERDKISIVHNTLTQVMESMDLRLSYSVEDRLSGEGELPVELAIKNMDSFKPEAIAANIPRLSRLLAARNLIKDLKPNLLDNREFRKRLEAVLQDEEAVQSLHAELQKLISTESPATENISE